MVHTVPSVQATPCRRIVLRSSVRSTDCRRYKCLSFPVSPPSCRTVSVGIKLYSWFFRSCPATPIEVHSLGRKFRTSEGLFISSLKLEKGGPGGLAFFFFAVLFLALPICVAVFVCTSRRLPLQCCRVRVRMYVCKTRVLC